MQALIDEFLSGYHRYQRWKFATCKPEADGGYVYLWKGGRKTKNPGIFASGKVVSKCYQDKDISEKEDSDSEKKENLVNFRDIEFDHFPRNAYDIVLPAELIEEEFGKRRNKIFNLQGSGKPFQGDAAKLERIWQEAANKFRYRPDYYLPQEITEDDEESFPEGTLERILVNRYERNAKARAKCIQIHGTQCKVCGFDFAKIYGELGLNYIQVHHLVEVSKMAKMGAEYKVNPEADLIPLCANCHQMIHRRTPMLTTQELEGLIKPDYMRFHRNN